MSDTYTKLAQAVKSLQRAGKLPVEPTDEQRADWAYGNAATSNPDVTYEMAVKAVEGAKTDLEAYEAIEDLAGDEAYDEVWGCNKHGETGKRKNGSYCMGCQYEATGCHLNIGVEAVDPNEQVTCEKHGQSYALFSNDYCTECAEAEGWFYPHWVEGDRVTLFNKPGTVRWVLPEGKGVAVVFEDGMMYWAYGEHIGEIGERE